MSNKIIAQRAKEASCAEEKGQMSYNIFIGSKETSVSNELARTDEMLLSIAERASLRLFVRELGDRIEEDTSLFTSTERKRLAFVQWLNDQGKLLE